MRITPLDIRKQEFKKAMRGLDPEEVYAFLNTVADEYEALLNDNKALRERVLELDDKVQEYRNMEKTLRDTLLTAERVNLEAKDNARREAGLIIKEAQVEAEKMLRNIKNQEARLRNSVKDLKRQKENYLTRLKMLAEAHLKFIESAEKDFEEEDGAVEEIAEATSPVEEKVSDRESTAERQRQAQWKPNERTPVEDETEHFPRPGEERRIEGGTSVEQQRMEGHEGVEVVEADRPDVRETSQETTGESAWGVLPEAPEESRKAIKEASEEGRKEQTRESNLPDLNEILDRMAATQKEMLSSNRGEPAESAAARPEKTASPRPPAEEQTEEEEWTLERLKRDILSGASGDDEKNR